MAILLEVNLMLFRKMDKTSSGNDARVLALITTLMCLFAGVVLVQSCMPE